MRIVIVGGSQFGVATAEKFIDGGHDVVLIDQSRERLDQLSDRLDCGMIQGDGTLPTIMRDVFQSDKDVLIALTNESEDNILSCLVGRSVGFGRVIPQIITADLLAVCEELGLSDAITPHATVADSIVSSIVDEADTEPAVKLHNDLRLVSHCVTSKIDGQTLADLDISDETRIIAHIRDTDEKLPDPDIKLAKGDHILFVARKNQREALAKLFSGTG
ncbi:potassium channel family protein [Pseudaestuariivita rosea]|uniref:potassium channel family protein n=1 Tax=Pseudaestuariivita rosea TaxID=2763263 RepID=UPI001ABB045E|nr:NAD-binding protein [Pseudaestuariivita rosea]